VGGELGTLRLRAGDNYVIARAQVNGTYELEVSDHVDGPVSDADRLAGIDRMLKEVSELRGQLYKEKRRLHGVLGIPMPVSIVKP
jgi:hypothetical protein